MEPFTIGLIALMAICCFSLAEQINPSKKEKEKPPEKEFAEALSKCMKYLASEIKKADEPSKKS